MTRLSGAYDGWMDEGTVTIVEKENHMIEIDKNVPLPPKTSRKRKYPWETMQIGDSFLIPEALRIYGYSMASRASKDYAPKKFCSRSVEGGARVWRIA